MTKDKSIRRIGFKQLLKKGRKNVSDKIYVQIHFFQILS